MNIEIVAVGKIKEEYLRKGIDDYLKRLSRYAKLKVIEIADEDISQRMPAEVKAREARKLAKYISPSDSRYVIALDIQGHEATSEELAEKLESLMVAGKSTVTFVIGGALGLDESVLNAADFRLSFSRMTFTHQIARFILLEQVYRSFKIIKGEPYHY
ncbi:MAG TPA: 23S rRNA (pseudouridine(1915)-N(3))-methyltransferase RlmH [Candidatus Aquicultor sp.]